MMNKILKWEDSWAKSLFHSNHKAGGKGGPVEMPFSTSHGFPS